MKTYQEKVTDLIAAIDNLGGLLDSDLAAVQPYADEIAALNDAVRAVNEPQTDDKTSPKEYRIKYNVGKVKYLVSYHDGIKTHKDGSPFFDIACFQNKKKLAAFVSSLAANGYTEQRIF